MSAPETIADVTAEMRRLMPNACGDWADRIDRAARPSADTLRDWFAGQALAGLCASMPVGRWTDTTQGIMGGKGLSGAAYTVADAMLAERAKVRS